MPKSNKITVATLLGLFFAAPAFAADRSSSSRTREMSSKTSQKAPSRSSIISNNSSKRPIRTPSVIRRPSNPKHYGPPSKFVPGPKSSVSNSRPSTTNVVRTRPNFSAQPPAVKPSTSKKLPTILPNRGAPVRMTIGRPVQTSGFQNLIDQSRKTAKTALQVINAGKTPAMPTRTDRQDAFQAIAESIDQAGIAAENAINDPIGTVNQVGMAGQKIVEGHAEVVHQTGLEVLRGAGQVIRETTDTAKGYHDGVVATAERVGNETQTHLNEFGQDLQPVIDATVGAANRVGGALGNKAEVVARAGQQALEPITSGINEAAGNATDAVNDAVQRTNDTVNDTVEATNDAANEAAQAAEEAAEAAAQAAQEAAEAAAQAAEQAAQQALEAAEQAKEDAKEGGKDAVQGTADVINNFIDSLL